MNNYTTASESNTARGIIKHLIAQKDKTHGRRRTTRHERSRIVDQLVLARRAGFGPRRLGGVAGGIGARRVRALGPAAPTVVRVAREGAERDRRRRT